MRAAAWATSLAAALACGGEAPAPRSLLLIVVDTVRADHLGLYGYARPTSTALDAWAQDAAVFERAYASSPWTLPSFGSIFTGQPPAVHGAGTRLDPGPKPNFAPLPRELPALAARLREHGFATAALVENPFLHPDFGVARGFESYRYLFRGFDAPPRADRMVEAALRWLGERDERPFFLMLHLMAPHAPYDPPRDVRGTFTAGYTGRFKIPFAGIAPFSAAQVNASPADRGFIAGAYDEELLGVDRALARLFAAVASERFGERLLVILTSDHGEELFDHGAFEHGHSLHDELLRIPLVVRAPGVRAARIDAPVSHVDLLPTILDALALPAPPGLAGVSLWPLLRGGSPPPERVLASERLLWGPEGRAWLRWPWKAIEMQGAAPLLFRLDEDPGETRDLSARDASELATLRRLGEARASAPSPAPDAAAIDAATREQLESLGYGD
jgi:arylsulfatase A-like enzyme